MRLHSIKRFKFVFLCKAVFIIFMLFLCYPVSSSAVLNGADVVLYNNLDGAWEEGLVKIREMLTAYNYSYEEISPADLNQATDLNSLYRVILFGGGWAEGYKTRISRKGYINPFFLQRFAHLSNK